MELPTDPIPRRDEILSNLFQLEQRLNPTLEKGVANQPRYDKIY